MGYRPNDWKNPFQEEVDAITLRGKERGISNPWYGEASVGLESYEEGADAVLEGLKRKGRRVDIADFGGENCYFPFLLTMPAKGYLVFIEED